MYVCAYLAGFPLFILLFEAVKDDGQHNRRPRQHVIDHFNALLAIVDLLDDSLGDGVALTTKSWGKPKIGSLCVGHDAELLNKGFHKLDCASAGFDVVVIVVAILFDAV